MQSKGLTANWSFTSTGPDHATEYTAYLKIGNGSQPVAFGIGTTQNKAKAEAARIYVELHSIP
ncbi:uncharacterized protein STEHIDRAFT_154747 [Stereum hirsutum FP-91666 SS1]|uniref:uncharacterized protein n=1 Tax=Stereum hirsutum (strain FP-91666) TaxID=721885 RepID=UPI000440A11B|nr:uncharacterized protein STEHIDRAFT_154747 [Stereum hirsutum FP-91666 SS1]EIM89057.1 hypothetical protein STEHIDRAFT_154747 [Stereum hirsutum FP-91666 SS1]